MNMNMNYSCTTHTYGCHAKEFRISVPDASLFSAWDYLIILIILFCVLFNIVHLFLLWLSLLIFYIPLRYVLAQRSVKEESVLVIRDLGVQLRTRYVNGKETSLFLDKNHIQSVIINEGIWRLCTIKFYLCFLLDNKKDRLVVAFQVRTVKICFSFKRPFLKLEFATKIENPVAHLSRNQTYIV